MTVAAHEPDRAAEATHDRGPDRARDPEPERAPAPVTGARGNHDLAALPVGARRPTSVWRGAVVQTKLTVSAPGDPLEVEADAVAARVVRGAEPRPPAAPDLSARGRLLRAATPARGPPPPAGSAERGSRTVGSIVARQGGGRPLDRAVRERIEPHVGMDLGSVRVRDGPDAAAAAHALHARAFTSGSTIFLAAGSSSADLGLMAHEATHVAQQASLPATRATLMRDLADLLPDVALPDVSVADVIPAWILDGVRSALQLTPGYALLTYITGTDPLTGAPVQVSPEWFVDQLLSFGPFGAGVGAALGAIDAVEGVFDLLAAELAANDLTPARIQRDIDSAWAQLSITLGVEGNLAIVRGYVERILADVAAFVAAIAERVLALVRAAAATAAEAVLESPAIQPVWSLAKKVLHYDPLRGLPVEAATVEILADFLRLIGEEDRLAQMEERGTLQQTADWLDTQFETFAGLATELATLYADAWAAIQPENLPNLLANLEALAARTVAYVQGVAAFAFTVIAKVLELVKQALLGLLSEHAHLLPGFHLLTVIIGQNPFTGEPVPLTAENLIRGFITLIPGGEATYDELVQSGVIPAAAARIEAAIASLGLTLELVTSTFLGIWNSFGLDDLLDPIAAFVRVLAAFGEPLWRLAQFVPVVVQVVIELILALMNFPSELLARVIANVSAAIGDITRDPVGFLKNMVEALKAGFLAFFSNIVVHLTQGLVDWLFRGLGKLGITLPTDFSLASILGLVLQVLGLTVESLWEKLTEHLGAEVVGEIQDNLARLTGAWAFLVDVHDRGLVAIWEYVADQLSSLWQTLLGVATEWVMTQIITSGTIKLLSFLDPTFIMSVVNGCIAFFNAVQAAIEYFRDMLELLDLYVGTIAQIAAGNIAPGAQMVEQGLAASVPMAIGFLAYLLGIDDVPDRIADIIRGVRDAIDRAIDWLIEQAIRLGSAALSALRSLGGGGGDTSERIEFQAAAESHELWLDAPGAEPTVMMASRPTPVAFVLDHFADRAEGLADPAEQNRARMVVDNACAVLARIERNVGLPTSDTNRVLAIWGVEGASLARSLVRVFELFQELTPATLGVTGERRGMTTSAHVSLLVDPGMTALPTGSRGAPVGTRQGRAVTTREGQAAFPLESDLNRTSRRAGGVVVPPDGNVPSTATTTVEQTVEVRTWATGDTPARMANTSHTERHFAAWFNGHDDTWRARVTRIELQNMPWGPCTTCASVLVGLLRQPLPNLRVAILLWYEPYDGGGSPVTRTSQESLREMQNVGWVLHPGPERAFAP
jgi:hypothetical protein